MSYVRGHPMISFFVLACALSWALLPIGTFFPPGALIAALVVAFITRGRDGLRDIGRRLIRWRVHPIWYAVAIGVPLLVHLVTIWINRGMGASAPDASQWTPWYGLALAIGMNIVDPLGGPLNEEPAFRGFAQPTMQSKRSPLVATALMAVGVTIWHGPLFFISSFGLRPIEAVTTAALTFWYAWLLNHAAGSVLLTLIAHATEGSINTSDLWPAGADLTRETILYGVVWVAAAVVLLVASRRFWTRPPSVVADRHVAGAVR
jgi:hypothetical protein